MEKIYQCVSKMHITNILELINSPMKSQILLIASVAVSLIMLKVVANSSSIDSLDIIELSSKFSRDSSLAGNKDDSQNCYI